MRRNDKRGSVLILSYLFTAALIIWHAADFRNTITQVRSSTTYTQTTQNFHLAEAGYVDAWHWLQNQPAPPAGIVSFDPFNPGATHCSTIDPSLPARPPVVLGTGQYFVCIDPDDTNPTSYLDNYLVSTSGATSTGQYARLVASLMRSQSFARFSYFTNSEELLWGGRMYNVWFTNNDHISGPVHSNDEFNISGNPIFDGMVSSGAPGINYHNGGPPADNPQFNGGLELGAEAVTMPFTATALRVAASSSGQWYEGNTTIVIQSNGTMQVTNINAGLSNTTVAMPGNGALFVNGGNVTVSGELDGQLTIGTSHDIHVANNITYHCNAQDPATDPDCLSGGTVAYNDDVLGLVAEQNVVIPATAPFDVTIQGSVMGMNDSFTVEQWWDTNNLKGTLTVYGGIIQNSRGAVGSFNGSTGVKRSGYSKDYYYDERLTGTAPPFYPTTDDYEELYWQEN